MNQPSECSAGAPREAPQAALATLPGRRLRDLLKPPAGYVQMVSCGSCGYLAPTPLASLIERFGADGEIDEAMKRVCCSACRQRGRAQARLLRLCDPGCGRYRG